MGKWRKSKEEKESEEVKKINRGNEYTFFLRIGVGRVLISKYKRLRCSVSLSLDTRDARRAKVLCKLYWRSPQQTQVKKTPVLL